MMVAAAIGLALAADAVAAGFVDPLDLPAQPSVLASRSLLQSVARAGSWLVAVGQRGAIVLSTDGGPPKQSPVPVSSRPHRGMLR